MAGQILAQLVVELVDMVRRRAIKQYLRSALSIFPVTFLGAKVDFLCLFLCLRFVHLTEKLVNILTFCLNLQSKSFLLISHAGRINL